MKAMVITPGKDEATLEFRDISEQKAKPGELLVRVKAAGVNRADILQRQGAYPTQARAGEDPLIVAGLEGAGEVAGLGDGVQGFKLGDRVMAMCTGGYAEFVTVDHRLAVQVPDRLTWEEAAAVPVAYMTEHNALVANGQLQAGESVLIHAASAGVGVAGVQLAKLFGAKPVMGTGGNPEKFEALRVLGLDVAINHKTQNFADAVLAHTQGNGVNLIIDHVGGPYLKESLRCMALKGRLVSVGRLGGNVGELDLDFLALRRLHLIGVTFRTRTLEERIEIVKLFVRDVLPALADGRLKPKIDRIFPLRQALEAQHYMASSAQVGKIVLTI